MQTEEPASEGITALLEPFIDTIIILSLSSLVILTSAIPNNLMNGELAGIELTSAAFEVHFSAAPFVIAVAALLFAFSTPAGVVLLRIKSMDLFGWRGALPGVGIPKLLLWRHRDRLYGSAFCRTGFFRRHDLRDRYSKSHRALSVLPQRSNGTFTDYINRIKSTG